MKDSLPPPGAVPAKVVTVDTPPAPWQAAPVRPTLSRGEVHVFRLWVNASPDPALLDWLSPDERDRTRSFRLESDRWRFAGARAWLRRLLGSYLDLEPVAVCFSYGAHGKPSLAGAWEGPRLRFNVSHAGGLALFAFAENLEVGVDVEQYRPMAETVAIAEHYFSPGEAKALRALAEPERTRAFFRGWTRKEALIKAIGEGLSRPLDSFEVPLGPAKPARILRAEGVATTSDDWWLVDLAPAEGYVAALAVEGCPTRLSCWRLESVRPGLPAPGEDPGPLDIA